MTDRTITAALLALLGLIGGAAHADGRREINQAIVDAAGGFPYTITQKGNYVLTSDLLVPTDTTALIIAPAGSVAIDMNGFRIEGPLPCNFAGCTSGGASAVTSDGFVSHVTLRNGEIKGFSGNCVDLDAGARIEHLHVSQCGLNGIVALNGSSVSHNVVDTVGHSGLDLGPGSVYSHNSVSLTDFTQGGHSAIEGGVATGGNHCADGSCAPRGERRFYLTDQTFDGGDAAGACAAGFEIATVYELLDLGALYYDFRRGSTNVPASGPSEFSLGWAYAGSNHCQDWTNNSTSGTVIELSTVPSLQDVGPWAVGIFDCDFVIRLPVWCIEQ